MNKELSGYEKKELLDHLLTFSSEHKNALFDKIIHYRTRYITVVLEDLFQSHNASAVLRTCDCFGIQDVHIIENNNKFEINPDIALGSAKWLSLYKYDMTKNTSGTILKELKSKGYRIVATTPHNSGCTLEKLKLDSKTALLFGTELNGLSKEAEDCADEFLTIPMYGFTESFNISVSAAIILYYLTGKLRFSTINWVLSDDEITDVKLQWVKNSVRSSDLIEKRYLKNI